MKKETLTKDNIDEVVMSYCTDGQAKLLDVKFKFDPTGVFSDNYANKQYILLFPNGYGASLVTHVFAYGGYEVALTDGGSLEDFNIIYLDEDYDYFNDVEGYLSTVKDLYEVFDFIRGLEPRKKHYKYFDDVEEHPSAIKELYRFYDMIDSIRGLKPRKEDK